MSRKSQATRTLAAAGIAAVAALGVTSTADAAIDKTLVYQCKFPIIAPGKISIHITANIPATWPTGVETDKWLVKADATLLAPVPYAMGTIDGLSKLDGKASAKVDLNLKDSGGTAFSVPANVNMTVPAVNYVMPDNEDATLLVPASGSTPALFQDSPSSGKIVLKSIALNMKAYNASGVALKLAPVTKDWNNNVIADSDGNPETFDVICRLDPATPGQGNADGTVDLANIAFIDDAGPVNVAPGAPGASTATPGDASVALSWGAATDSDGTVAKYNVYQNGSLKTTVTGTSTTISGLTNGTEYSYEVSAVDDDNAEGAKNAVVKATPQAVVVPNQKPTTPPAAATTGIGTTTATLNWGTSTDPDGTVTGYRITGEDNFSKDVAASVHTLALTGLGPESDYEYFVTAIDNKGATSATPLKIAFTTLKDNTNVKPTVPGVPTGTTTETTAALTWAISTDVDGIKSYDVYKNGVKLATVAGNTNTYTATGLTPNTAYKFSVSATDNNATPATSAQSAEATLTTKADTTAPSNPVVSATTPAYNQAVLTWTAATDNVGVTGYDVYNGATKVATVTGLTTTINGLLPSTSYTFKVVARDAAGNSSNPGGSVTKTTPEAPTTQPGVKYNYTLAGNTVLKNLTTGSLPLSGTIKANLDLQTGTFVADLVLNPTTGRLTALGFLPVTAKIGFAPSGQTTGTLGDGVLKTNSKVRIKVQEVKLFGAIPLAGGNNCQTKSLSDINLQSTQEFFDHTKGGPIAGKYSISDLNGCGVLNGLVSPLTAGSNNTISLNLNNPTKG